MERFDNLHSISRSYIGNYFVNIFQAESLIICYLCRGKVKQNSVKLSSSMVLFLNVLLYIVDNYL